jgi:hypothetical protein
MQVLNMMMKMNKKTKETILTFVIVALSATITFISPYKTYIPLYIIILLCSRLLARIILFFK